MSRRDDNVAVFRDTESRYTTNGTLVQAVKSSISAQKIYPEGCSDIADYVPEKKYESPAKVVVSKKRSFEAASAYVGMKVCVHNFASAGNPGGGVTSGASAQEECLCRCSTLYPCLTDSIAYKKFYKPHRDAHDPLHNDDCIYTPDVVVFKTDTQVPQYMEENKWYKVDVITCAAPNLRERPSNSYNPTDGDRKARITDNDLLKLHEKRMRAVLNAAAINGAEVLILGAFGCGAFENPPLVVAQAMRNILPDYLHTFKCIEFAVYCRPNDDSNFRTFNMKLSRL